MQVINMAERIKRIEQAFENTVARILVLHVPYWTRELCKGCDIIDRRRQIVYDHQSELKHDVCYLMSIKQRVDLIFDKALPNICEDDLWLCFMEEICTSLHPPPHYEEYQHVCQYKPWYTAPNLNKKWKKRVAALMVKELS